MKNGTKVWILPALVALLAVALISPLVAQEKPRIAVIEFDADAAQQWWSWWNGGGANAVQEVLVTELVKSGKFRVIEREKLDALLKEKNLALSGSLDPASAVKAGRLLGVKYLVTGAVTEFGESNSGARAPGLRGLPSVSVGRKKFAAAVNARLIDTETGEIVWADDAREETKSASVFVGGFGGGADDNAPFDKILKPLVQKLAAGIAAANL